MSSAGRIWHAILSRLPRGRQGATSVDLPCRCGHPHEAHEHYRPGTDCALCSCSCYCYCYRVT